MELEPIYYLSPHADDVAFSCAGSVALDVAAGRAVTLITAFLSGAAADVRRSEDEAAAKLLGCEYKCLDLPDAPQRPEVRGSLDVFMSFGPQHLGITNEVVSRLLWHIKAPAEVRAPLGVGGHVDHRIVHEAARALAYHLGRGIKLSFYEDLPYALAPYALGRRLSALTKADARIMRLLGAERAELSEEIAASRSFFLTWPMMKKSLPGLRQLGGHLMARRSVQADLSIAPPGFAPRLQPVLRPLTAQALAARRQAIAAYASQWPEFAASLDELSEKFERYGRRYERGDVVCERLFTDDGVHGV
jgi:LmbE family N-acetylglucosaminyl deacetylase